MILARADLGTYGRGDAGVKHTHSVQAKARKGTHPAAGFADQRPLVHAAVQVVQDLGEVVDAGSETGEASQLAAGQHQAAYGARQVDEHAGGLVVVFHVTFTERGLAVAKSGAGNHPKPDNSGKVWQHTDGA